MITMSMSSTMEIWMGRERSTVWYRRFGVRKSHPVTSLPVQSVRQS